MPHKQIDRKHVRFKPLADRENKINIERDRILSDEKPAPLDPRTDALLHQAGADVKRAWQNHQPVMLSFGAHTIKNGLGPLIIDLLEKGCFTHLATNGAGIIHDWEFSFQGASSEDVRKYVAEGQFGIWEETGAYINLALCLGAWKGLGYGESIGAMITRQGLQIPSLEALEDTAARASAAGQYAHAARALDLLAQIQNQGLQPGFLSIAHPYAQYSVQAAAFGLNIPFTGHPMFGHDIIYCHPMCSGAAIGRTAERDFLTFAQAVGELDKGIYLSVGSAVMSPMIFEKSMAMARNLAHQKDLGLNDFSIYVVDLTPSDWDWRKGEPPLTDPAYYQRYLKTFNRMGGKMHYIAADNRDFFLSLAHTLLG